MVILYTIVKKNYKNYCRANAKTYPLELIEIIIADDGSSDNPDKLVDLFSKNLDIKYIRQGRWLSTVRNMNKGIEVMKHNQITILDCDMLPP